MGETDQSSLEKVDTGVLQNIQENNNVIVPSPRLLLLLARAAVEFPCS